MIVVAFPGEEASLGFEFLLSDELLDVIDRDRLVDGSAGAVELARMVADAAADRGEGVLVLDEGERFFVAAFARHLDVALDGDVGGAGGLTGRGAGFGNDVLAVEAVVRVAFGDADGVGAKGLVEGDLGLFLLVELHAQTDGVDGAVFDAFAARHAVGGGDFAAVVASDRVVGFEFLNRAEAKASAAAAVADRGGVAVFD